MTKLAATPLSWLSPDSSDAPAWENALDRVARLGFRYVELGPVGYVPESTETLRPVLSRLDLSLASATRFLRLRHPDAGDENVALVHAVAPVLRDFGATHLVVIDRPDGEAGPGGEPVGIELSKREWQTFLASLQSIAAILEDSYGLRVAFHPHFASAVFHEGDIDRLLGESDVDLCFDTGHALWGGVDPKQALNVYSDRIAAIHIRNVSGSGTYEPRSLEEGIYDFSTVTEELSRPGFNGWITLDQDPVPDADPDAVLRQNLEYLETIGIVSSVAL